MRMVYNGHIQDYVCHGNAAVWVVKDVEPRKDYTLLLTFAGGETRLYDAHPLLEKSLYTPLKSLAFFMGARVDGDTVIWSDEVDIAPEHLYECSKPI